MCGIGGIIQLDGKAVDVSLVARFSNLMRHRGPDDVGFLVDDGTSFVRRRDARSLPAGSIALIHRRLAIIDTSSGGWQPRVTDNGRHAIVFNGEIYNYIELRAQLARAGVAFSSQSDTEVLLAGLVQDGPRFLEKCIGMFAFALLDRERQKLLLGRDFAGMKPLYWRLDRQRFAFASEIKPLLAVAENRPKADPGRLEAFLSSAISDTGGRTMFQGIEALPQGHFAEVAIDRPAVRPVAFWTTDATSPIEADATAAAERLQTLFLDSVKLHLRSDVPLGAALSGGIDSSATVMAMRASLGPAAEIHTFSYVAGKGAPSEEAYASLVAEAARTHHHESRPTPDELARDLDDLVETQEEPFASTSMYAQSRVFRMVREAGIVVSLDGQGADEYLAGYPTFYAARIASLLRSGRVGAALGLARQASARRAISPIGLAARLAATWLPAFGVSQARFVRSQWRAQHRSPRPPQTGSDPFRAKLVDAFSRSSLPALLRYADRNSMRWSVESRMPFLVPELVTTVLAMPGDLVLSPSGETKAVFRRAMRGLVPDAILDRRDKVGFVTPETHWVTAIAPWVERLLASDAARLIPAVDPGRLSAAWASARAGRIAVEGPLWRALAVIAWTKRFNVHHES